MYTDFINSLEGKKRVLSCNFLRTNFAFKRLICSHCISRGFPSGTVVKMQETKEIQVRSLGQEDPLEEEMANHSSILPGKISWTEVLTGLHSLGSQRLSHD